jgi:HEAT repeat protein
LRSGNTVLISSQRDWASRVVEVTRRGKVVWEMFGERGQGLTSVHPCLDLVRVGFHGPRPAAFDLDTVPWRIVALQSNNPRVRSGSAGWLGNQGAKAEAAVPALVNALGDNDREVLSQASHALWKIGPTAYPEVAKRLKHQAPQVRAAAAGLVASFVGRGDRRARAATPELFALLRDEDATVREEVIACLRETKLGPKVIVPALVGALADKDPGVRVAAARQLEMVGPEARAAVPALLKALKGKDQELAYWCATALGGIGPEDKEVIPALIAVLKDGQNRNLGRAAAYAFAEMGPRAEPAVPSLVDAINTDTKDPRLGNARLDACMLALGKIGKGTEAVDAALIRVLKDKRRHYQIRWRAADALAGLRPVRREAAVALAEILGEEGVHKRLADIAAYALGRMGPAAKDAVPVLMQLAADSKCRYSGRASQLWVSIVTGR